MREFSEFEKKVIKRIVKYCTQEQTNCLHNLLFDFDGFLDGFMNCCMYHENEDETEIAFNENLLCTDQNGLNHTYCQTLGKLYAIVNLLDELIEDKMLTFIPNDRKNLFKSKDEGFQDFNILDKNLQKKLYYYDYGSLLPTYLLIEFADRGFLSEKQANDKKEKCLTNLITIVAIVVPLLTAIITATFTVEVNIKNDSLSVSNEKLNSTIENQEKLISEIQGTVETQKKIISAQEDEIIELRTVISNINKEVKKVEK